ncbi:MAG: hypothetical protein FJW40_25760 [Acidobacteria bacterium]|nr:hypothetical protein [Acidobacteriota bacterium]
MHEPEPFRQMIEEKLDELTEGSPDRRNQTTALPGGSRAPGHARSGFAEASASGRGLRDEPADPGAELMSERMEEGVFAECEACRRPLPAARLRKVPWQRYCVMCQDVIGAHSRGRRSPGPAENLVNSLFAA